MFYLGSNRGLCALHAPGMILTTLAKLTNLGRFAVDAIPNLFATLVANHCVVALVRAAVSAVAIDVFFIA